MAIAINPKTEIYPDTPLTKFPVSEDNKKRMMDIPIELWTIVGQYNKYCAEGNFNAANNLIKNNPDILDCFFNADKWNWTRDAIIALQRYFLEEVVAFINNVSKNTVGINDTPTTGQASLVAYSAEKVNTLLEVLSKEITDGDKNTLNTISLVKIAAIPFSGWSSSAPYTQTITVSGMASNDKPIISVYYGENSTASNIKAQGKAWGMVDRGISNNGSITFYCYNKKPAVDFSVQIKGV